MITNKNMIFRKVNNDSRTTDKYLSLPEVSTASLTAVAADNEGGIVYDATTNTVKYSNGSAWANIATGGAAENAYATFNCPTGTDPIASSSTDTLNFTTADDTLVVTGTVGTDTIDFKVGTNIANANIGASAAIAYSKLNLTGVVENADLAGSIAYSKLSLTNSIVSGDLAGSIAVGKIAIATGSIMLGTASVGAALDAKTDTAILIGDGSTAAMQTISGDATMTNAGVLSVSDLTIASEVAGDILYFDGTNWIRLAKPGATDMYLEGGTTPVWSVVSAGIASSLAQSVTAEAGTYDYTLAFTTLTSSASTLTIPDMAGDDGTFAFINKAQTITHNQTIQYSHLFLNDNDEGQTLQILVNENMTGDKTLTYKPNDGSREISLSGNLTIAGDVTTTIGTVALAADAGGSSSLTLPATGTVATLAGTEALSAKTLTTPKIVTTGYIADAGGDEYLEFVESTTPLNHVVITQGDTTVLPMITSAGEANIGLMLHGNGTGNVAITDGGDITAKAEFELDGATTATTMTLTMSQTVDRAITFPDATDTLVGKATADALTNKTVDCNGTGNVVTNVNVKELDPVGDAATGVTFVVSKTVTDLAAAGTNILTTHKKLRVIDVWFVATSDNAGTIAVHSGQTGSIGTAISNTITSTSTDKALIRTDGLDDAEWDVAENGGLVAVGDGGASIDGVIFVECMRID